MYNKEKNVKDIRILVKLEFAVHDDIHIAGLIVPEASQISEPFILTNPLGEIQCSNEEVS